MARLTLALLLLSTLWPLAGCAPEETAAVEPAASKEMGTAEANQWTEEQKKAFKVAHDRARNGEDK